MAEVALRPNADPLATARLHTVLRFAVGVTASFVLGEALGWTPSFLIPMLTGVVLASLPVAPPPKLGILLMAAMALSAFFAFVLSSLLIAWPTILVGCIGIVVFVALHTIAHGRAALPMTLLLLCITAIPVVTMVTPANADVLPGALVRGMILAVVVVWIVHAIWPQVLPPAASPQPAAVSPLPTRTALVGTAIIMPLMLVYLLFGLYDAMPALITTVLLVTTFDVQIGATKGLVRVIGVVLGGFAGVLAYMLLGIAPSLPVLALVILLFTTIAAHFVALGGAAGATALQACNSGLVIFGIALLNPDSSAGVWVTRLSLFFGAWLFAIGMMILFMPGRDDRGAQETSSGR